MGFLGRCYHCGQLLRAASTLRYHGATILTGAVILDSSCGTFYFGSRGLGREGGARYCFDGFSGALLRDYMHTHALTTLEVMGPGRMELINKAE